MNQSDYLSALEMFHIPYGFSEDFYKTSDYDPKVDKLAQKIGNIANYYKEQVESIIEKYEQELDQVIEQNNCEIRMGLICKRN